MQWMKYQQSPNNPKKKIAMLTKISTLMIMIMMMMLMMIYHHFSHKKTMQNSNDTQAARGSKLKSGTHQVLKTSTINMAPSTSILTIPK